MTRWCWCRCPLHPAFIVVIVVFIVLVTSLWLSIWSHLVVSSLVSSLAVFWFGFWQSWLFRRRRHYHGDRDPLVTVILPFLGLTLFPLRFPLVPSSSTHVVSRLCINFFLIVFAWLVGQQPRIGPDNTKLTGAIPRHIIGRTNLRPYSTCYIKEILLYNKHKPRVKY